MCQKLRIKPRDKVDRSRKKTQPDKNWSLANFTIHLKGTTASQVANIGSGNLEEGVSSLIMYVWFLYSLCSVLKNCCVCNIYLNANLKSNLK